MYSQPAYIHSDEAISIKEVHAIHPTVLGVL